MYIKKKITNGVNMAFGILIAFFVVVSCQNTAKPKIGFLIHDVEGRWINDLENFKREYAEQGIEMVVKDAGGNEGLQLKQVNELIGAKVNAIVVVAVNQNTAAGLVRKAKRHRIPVIAYDRMIRNADLSYFISYEYYRMGELMSAYALKNVPQGNYVLLWGDASDGNAQLLREGQESFFYKNGNKHANLLYRAYVEGWSYNNAREIVQRVVDFSDQPVDVILASNDEIARAAREVLDLSGFKESLVITSHDAVADAFLLKQSGNTDVFKTDAELATLTVKMTCEIIKRKKVVDVNRNVFNGRKEVPSVLVMPRY
jgi:D-xylose transport system substrate-binding protein